MLNAHIAKTTLADFQALIDATPAEAAHVRLSPDSWTLTEIVGHLVDSASNNHQRFTRLQYGDLDHFPGYDAEPWVAAQQYDGMDFTALSTLWTTYNEFLLHLAASTPESALGNVWRNDGTEASLGFLIEDYYRHMRMHVDHYKERLVQVTAA